MPYERDSEAVGDVGLWPRRRPWRWYEDTSEAGRTTEFQPSPRRWYGRKALMFLAWTCLVEGLIAVVVAAVTVTQTQKSTSSFGWLVLGPFIVFGVYARLTNPIENFVVRVSSRELSGPQLQRWPWQVRPYTIRLADIDPFRSARRGKLDRLLGRQSLWSTYGTKIFLQRRSFDHADVRRLLGLLRVRD